ncbi:MAG: hypothetical protein ABIU63_08245 [Chitinophagaceae bacterium]
MLITRTLLTALLISASLFSSAADELPALREKGAATVNPATEVNYTFHIDNTVNKNNAVDSVLVILDKYDRSGAGIVTKVFYPGAGNMVVITDLPAGKYYAEVYVLGLYKKHFSAVIATEKAGKKNKATLHMDYKDVYTPGNVILPAEDTRLFAFNR